MANTMSSILDTIKQMLGDSGDTSFDVDLVIDINSAIAGLTQLGIGPQTGFEISDNTATWADLLNGDKRFGFAKTYVYLKTKLVFDPPLNSAVIDSMTNQIKELEWRLCNASDINPI